MSTNKKHIVITGPSLIDPGGVSNYYTNILPILNKNKEFSITYFPLGKTQRSFGILYPLFDQVSFKKKIKKETPCITHINPSLDIKSFIRDGLLVRQSIKNNIKVVVMFHGWDHCFQEKINKKYFWFFKATFAKADYFIVLASEFADQLRDWGVNAPIYLGTTSVQNSLLNGFSLSRKISEIRFNKTIKVLFLARLENKKGALETLKAINILQGKNYKVTLTIAGDGPAMQTIQSYIKKNNIEPDRVNLIGYVTGDEKKSAFATHQIYCFPTSYGEGLPTSVLEAMAFAMPVITRPMGGLKDMFKNGKMGYISKTTDPEVIAQYIEKLINNRELMVEMANYNNNYALNNVMGNEVASTIRDIYVRL